RRTRVRNPPLPTKPLPKSQQETRTVKRRAGHVGGEGVTEQRLGVFLGRKEWTRVHQANVEPWGGCLASQRLELAHDRPSLIVVSAVRGCLGEIAERPATHHLVIGRVAWLEQS